MHTCIHLDISNIYIYIHTHTHTHTQLAETASQHSRAYVGFPIHISGEATVVTDYSADRWASVYRPLTASVSGDLDAAPEDLVRVLCAVCVCVCVCVRACARACVTQQVPQVPYV